jgi:hypothetical protein
LKCPKCGHEFIPTSGRPRSTGKYSQSAHLHGHLQQLAQHCGYSMGELKDAMKEDCAFWPYHEVVLGSTVHMVPISEADATVEVESQAIEWVHMRAAEVGCPLREE